MKRTSRILAILLALAMLLSVTAFAAWDVYADDDTLNNITIDLTDYPDDISCKEDADEVTTFTIEAGTKKIFSYEVSRTSRGIRLTPNAEKPVQKWEINGTEYSYADSGSDAYYIELSDEFDATIAQTFMTTHF